MNDEELLKIKERLEEVLQYLFEIDGALDHACDEIYKILDEVDYLLSELDYKKSEKE